NEIVPLAEKNMGVQFEDVYDSLEKVGSGEVSEILGIELLYEAFGGGPEAKRFVMGWFAGYAECMEKGQFCYRKGPLWSEEFSHVVEKLTFNKA
ncbi:hypothetical protein COCC4DRAFT_138141, partial [Bipolaris maydis ATCC 48331]